MSARLADTFAACRRDGRAALVTYVMAGDPDLRTSEAMALACLEGGADVIELGVPFSDPIADGPTIQAAAERALRKGTTLADCLTLAARLRRRSSAPIVLMGYYNPFVAMGEERFFTRAAAAGVDGVIIPDLLPEEAGRHGELARAHGIDTVFLVAPTSTPERRRAAVAATSGFVYFVSVTGVTGARATLPSELAAQVGALRAESPVPVVIGFGVSSPAQARTLAPLADGVVVGSAIVSRIAEGGARAARVKRFVRSLRRALG